jgi:hypothetical protein
MSRRLTVHWVAGHLLARIGLRHVGLPAIRRTEGIVLGCGRLLGIAIWLRWVLLSGRLRNIGLGNLGVARMLLRRVRLKGWLDLNLRRV